MNNAARKLRLDRRWRRYQDRLIKLYPDHPSTKGMERNYNRMVFLNHMRIYRDGPF